MEAMPEDEEPRTDVARAGRLTTMEAMPEDEQPRTPIGEFLRPLGLDQYRETMRQLGFDNPATDFPAQTPEDAQDMKAALLGAKVPVGHVSKIMRSANAMRPSTSA